MLGCLGQDRLIAMQAQVDARRQARKPNDDFLSRARAYFSKSLEQQIRSRVSLQSLKERGYLPIDLVQRKIRWEVLKYPVPELQDFGIDFETALELGFQSHHFQAFDIEDFRTLRIRKDEMLKTNITMNDLLKMQLSPADFYELGFRFDDFRALGANQATLKKFCSDKDLQLYFKPRAKKATTVTTAGIKF